MSGAVAGVDVVFVAVPVGAVAQVAGEALAAGAPVVTDVGSVKQPIVEAVMAHAGAAAARFVGGHPMAGSEQDGVDAARIAAVAGVLEVLERDLGKARKALLEKFFGIQIECYVVPWLDSKSPGAFGPAEMVTVPS